MKKVGGKLVPGAYDQVSPTELASVENPNHGNPEDGKFFQEDVIVDESVKKIAQGTGREIAIAIGELFGNFHKNSESVRIGPSATVIETLLRKATPQDKSECIKLAQAWRENDDFLGKLIKIVIDFSMTGAGFFVDAGTSQGDTEADEEAAITKDSAVDDFLRKFNRKYKLRKVVRDLLQDYRVTDSMILYWKIKIKNQAPDNISGEAIGPELQGLYDDVTPELVDISALNPADVDWNNSIGNNILRVKIPAELKDRIKSAISADNVKAIAIKHKLPNDTYLKIAEQVQSLLNSGVHMRWIAAVAMGQDYIELRNDEGDYWLVQTQQRKHHGLAMPSMRPVFVALTTRQLLSDGEFTAAFITKHFIMLVQGGESIQTGPMAGSRQNYLQQSEADALNEKLRDVSKAMKLVVDHTVKISFVFPPKEFFNREKFANCEGRILNWADVTYAVTEGEGGSYGSGFIGIKRLLASIVNARSDVSGLITEFFDHPTIREHIDIEEQEDVVVGFDEQILKEPQQLLREIEFLFQSAIMDSRTAATELGRNPDRLRQSKRRTRAEDEADQSWSPVNSMQAGADTTSIVDKGGRPANPETTQNPETRQQTGNPNS